MDKLNKLLNDLSKHKTSFKNLENDINGTFLCEDLFMNENNNLMYMVDYRFNGFIKLKTTWRIDVNIDCPDIERKIQYKGKNQKLIKERVYILLMKMSNLDEVFRKINQS